MFGSAGQLFYYRFVVLLELFLAEILLCRNLKKRKHFLLRLVLSVLSVFLIVALSPIVYTVAYLFCMFTVMFVLTVGVLWACFEESLWNVIFCSIVAYCVQHISYVTYMLVVSYFSIDKVFEPIIADNPYFSAYFKGEAERGYSVITAMTYAEVYFCIYWVIIRVFGSKIKKGANLHIHNPSLVFVNALLLIFAILFNLMFVYSDMPNNGFSYLFQISNIFICFIIILFLFSQLSVKEKSAELEQMQFLFDERSRQYEASKKNIELINFKCHDLKHQLRSMRDRSQLPETEIERMEHLLEIYDREVHTGNEALDTILTEKQLLCSNENIEFSIMADGKLLSFMKEYDIYSLFGNAIDNAVEALKKIPEEERMLTLSIFEEKNMTVIRMENTFDGTIKTSDGRIQTTKKDDGFHGFGILSMKEIVERYNGLFAWSAKNNLFKITIACKKSSSSQPLTPLTGENM